VAGDEGGDRLRDGLVGVAQTQVVDGDRARRAEAGEEIVLTRNGKPVARLSEAKPEPHPGELRMAAMGRFRGQLNISDDFDELGPEWDEYLS